MYLNWTHFQVQLNSTYPDADYPDRQSSARAKLLPTVKVLQLFMSDTYKKLCINVLFVCK